MKKIIISILICIFLSGCNNNKESLEPFDNHMDQVKNYPYHSFSHSNDLSNPKQDEWNIECKKDGQIEDYWVQSVEEEMSQIPLKIRMKFIEDGWNIYVTDMDIDLTYYNGKYGSVMGSTNYKEKRILIENRENAIHEATIHEFGHWFDYYLGNPSLTDEFKTIYEKEKDRFIESFHSNTVWNPMELFAEGFWKYIVSPDELQQTNQSLYLYMDTLINDF